MPILDQLASLYPSTKFVKIVSDHCIENYPDKNVPTMLVYRKGQMMGQIVGLGSVGGLKATLRGEPSKLFLSFVALRHELIGSNSPKRQTSNASCSRSGVSTFTTRSGTARTPSRLNSLRNRTRRRRSRNSEARRRGRRGKKRKSATMTARIARTIRLSSEGAGRVGSGRARGGDRTGKTTATATSLICNDPLDRNIVIGTGRGT